LTTVVLLLTGALLAVLHGFVRLCAALIVALARALRSRG